MNGKPTGTKVAPEFGARQLVILAWLYSDEITEAIQSVFEAVAEHGAVVPTLWRLEIADSLTVAARRGRIDREFRHAALSDLTLLEIATDPHTDMNAWGQTL
jgi:predicted nucleic acid-binding protein